MSFLRTTLITAALIYLALLVVIYLLQRHLLYHPSHVQVSPEDVGLAGVEVVNLATQPDEKLIAWYAPAQAGKPTILFFHGNAGDISGRAERFAYYQRAGYGVMFLSYRGYGTSTGSPSEAGLISDANAAYDWLVQHDVPASKIVLVGESLGTGVSMQLAAHKPVAAIALEAPFTSTADVARLSYWWLPVGLLMKDQFKSIDYVKDIRVPLLVMHGTDDRLIPLQMGERLFAAANEPKEFVAIANGTHGSIFSEPAWQHEIEFFNRHLGS
ncbi:MAG: alpha/beta hydrolase [Hyphomicrobiales bacterium]